ncbi:type IX secretion system sortase PorU [Cytophagales bacterium LB-30]|uniref:Type IX secretion system sortase PorU n=1 Tax=Shiella aurantiaca TaxID=3058365 RepID=A0ABT8F2X3_9BACT|nr:type IX secretion system sortase PorU [Shiella aurantiaca]MDN4164704.1 type IX secretion system sortase PorU [Shiella aurantiaca]
MKKILFLCFILLAGIGLKQSYAQPVLRNGTWYKVGITEEGMYKIDAELLRQLGVNVSTVNPTRLQVYGNGGQMLPQPNALARPVDLLEVSTQFVGNTDATWQDNEYLLFFAPGPHTLRYDADANRYEYQQNIYSDTSYYFLRVDGNAPARVGTQTSLGSGFPVVSSFDQVIYHEQERINVLTSGRSWYGERMNLSEPSLSFDLPNQDLVASKEAFFEVKVMGQSYLPVSFDVKANNQVIGNIPIDRIPDPNVNYLNAYEEKGVEGVISQRLPVQALSVGAGLKLTIQFNGEAAAGRSLGYLDSYLAVLPTALRLNGPFTVFRSAESLQNLFTIYEIQGVNASAQVWDVTQANQAINYTLTLNGGKGTFVAPSTDLRTYVVFSGSDFARPKAMGAVANQNISGQPVPDAIFVCPPAFYAEAQRLAAHREGQSGLSVLVLTDRQVFNEFSSGSADVVAIRDMVRSFYQRNPQKLKYLLLMADATFDYKNILGNNKEWIMGYQSLESLEPVDTYASDDFFGMMGEDEGEWNEAKVNTDNSDIEIGIGRFPVQSVEELQHIIDKIIFYDSSPLTLGAWRNSFVFVADDEDSNTHQRDAERLSTLVDTSFTTFSSKKIYMDAYRQELEGSTERVPAMTQALIEQIEEGALLINYTGHGSEERLGHESIFTKENIQNLSNTQRLPMFITATCEFGRHDDPSRNSAGELLLIQKEKGAIALLTTARPVRSGSNFVANWAFCQSVFEKQNGEWPRLGDVIRNTKNRSLLGTNNRNFILLGDPTMQLAYPKYNAKITSSNGAPINRNATQLKSLEKVLLAGHIEDASGNVYTQFNGKLRAEVYDKVNTLETLGNTGNSKMNYWSRNSVLFRGEVSVVNGEFEFEFLVPKNIDYRVGPGKITLYALQEDLSEDAGGATIDFQIGGSSENAFVDTTPPQVHVFMNDSTFRSGGKTDADARIVAKISDESGVNISRAGIGHEIIATLNAEEAAYEMNDYYTASLDTYQSGWVDFPVKGLPEGKNYLTVKAWDSFNNSGEGMVEFYVLKEGVLAIERVFNFPNPFSDQTEIVFEHSRGGDPLEIEVHIFGANGQKVNTLYGSYQEASSQAQNLVWDATDSEGHKVPQGIYLLKLVVRSPIDGAKSELSHKLVVMN